ncbi:WD40-repeat-containing domain protein [Phascolomyces articulosus]|uniref:WD40-repeat-containing domain protein n=1 Tax=Phascolomyces articulosus TaxID=60185 RepID=A0AAD5K8R3_9FUNG|nr:WD40-repeat-containing domain protein [Phascolomyces articulosus]
MIYLPQICPQPDWHDLIPEISDHSTTDTSFWISGYRKDDTSIHGTVKVDRVQGEQKVAIHGENGVDVEYINSRTLITSCSQVGAKDITIYAPWKEWKSALSKPVLAIDASHEGRLCAYTQEQHIIVASIQDGETQTIMKGHVADVTTVRFFPSNQEEVGRRTMLLSGGSDFQAKIWSVDDGSNPVTLTGHTAGITDLAIVSVGRNVLSMWQNLEIERKNLTYPYLYTKAFFCRWYIKLASSKDGTIRLWHCGSGASIAVLGNYQVPVTTMILTSLPDNYEPVDLSTLDEREVDTGDKLVLVGLNDGSVRGIHLGTKEEIFSIETDATKVSALQYDPITKIVLVGGENGIVEVFELSNLDRPKLEWQRSDHAVTGLGIRRSNDGEVFVFVSNADGSIYSTNNLLNAVQNNSNLQVSTEYSGNELESINDISLITENFANKHQLLCCNREGYIKIY